MDNARQRRDEQHELWNGVAADAWVEAQELLDALFKPFERLLVEAIAARSVQQVLDVGCGTGSTTLAAVRGLEAGARGTGIDISGPMIAAARARGGQESGRATFIRADAQSHAFESGSFDAIISRFGVMFFDDPVIAFANLRRATRSRGELRFVAWRAAEENPFMTTAERAAAPLVADIPPRRPGEPGQFAFADPHRIQHILQASGWTEIDIRPIDVACAFPTSGLELYMTRLGPLGRILHKIDDSTRSQVIERVRHAFAPYVHGTQVRFDGACWMVGARAPYSAVQEVASV